MNVDCEYTKTGTCTVAALTPLAGSDAERAVSMNGCGRQKQDEAGHSDTGDGGINTTSLHA